MDRGNTKQVILETALELNCVVLFLNAAQRRNGRKGA